LGCIDRGERASVKSAADARNNQIDEIARAERIERRQTMVSAACPSPKGPLGNVCMP
jgi:hypothetical protein